MLKSALLLALLVLPMTAEALSPRPSLSPRPGWQVMPTDKPYAALLADLKTAVRAAKMGIVTEAGPTGAAASRGITIPGNRVVGVFRNDFAVRALAASEAAMIEAPIRFYVTEGPGAGATLSWKTPSHVFAPYADGGADLQAVAQELDAIFAAIGAAAAR
ncbi:MAG: hypothetical protein ACJA1L_003268 [Paracoccaceae bacterium]|jgi:uncharacterized protein (DUF302 family)